MSGIGADIGTYNLVLCKRDEEGKFIYKKEINAFLEIPIDDDNRFVFNMMKNAELSAGRKVPIIENKEEKIAYVMGEAAINMAYAINKLEVKRPMKDGCLNPKEKSAQQIMNKMVHGMIGTCSPNETLYFSKPANAINEETDADYHAKVLEAIFKAFKDKDGNKVKPHPINEGLALVYAELTEKQWTGCGVSLGGGMVNVCFAIYGNPIFEFSLVNAGDYIDKMAAKATGESSTYVNKEKLKLDLTIDSTVLVQRALKAQYELMVQKTVLGIKKGLEQSESKIRADNPIDIVIAGGTSCPNGFDILFRNIVAQSGLPLPIGSIIRPSDPLFSVSRGCLIAAEAANKS
jgi:hypothetical protein